jgi:hypothetical protein
MTPRARSSTDQSASETVRSSSTVLACNTVQIGTSKSKPLLNPPHSPPTPAIPPPDCQTGTYPKHAGAVPA